MAYRFSEGEPVVIVSQDSGRVIAVRKVATGGDVLVTLDDGSVWYAGGLPVEGRANRRLTVLLPQIEKQLSRIENALVLVEVATILSEVARQRTRLSDRSVERATRVMTELLESHAASLPKNDGAAFRRRLTAQIAAARRSAIEDHLHEVEI